MTGGIDWLLVSCIVSFVMACIIGLVLTAFWLADQTDDTDYERTQDDIRLAEIMWGKIR